MKNKFVEEVGWPQVHGQESSVKFTIQSGPIRKHGVNGCQIDDVVRWAKKKIEEFNKAFPSPQNSLVVTKLDEALLWLYISHSRRKLQSCRKERTEAFGADRIDIGVPARKGKKGGER